MLLLSTEVITYIVIEFFPELVNIVGLIHFKSQINNDIFMKRTTDW